VQDSDAVRRGLLDFYERFSAQDADGFADAIATGPAVSVVGSAPGEGHADRESWVAAYRDSIADLGLRLEPGPDPKGWEEGSVGLALDEPRFVMPDGSFLPTRLTGVLHREGGAWKIVHLHFSVAVPDEQAVQPAT
jgi:ketosteroid isomerase-like protein